MRIGTKNRRSSENRMNSRREFDELRELVHEPVISPAGHTVGAAGGARFGPSRKYRAGECMMPLSKDGSCLLTAVLLGALLNGLAGPVALSHPSEPHAAEAQFISAPTCDAVDVGVTQLGPLPIAEIPNAHPGTSTEIATARNYLIETASPGYTMARQGPDLAIGRLNPEFAVRLANAVREARQAGLPSAGVFSAYRPPAFGIGGFFDKFQHDTVPGCNFIPKLRCRRARPPNAVHIHGEPIGRTVADLVSTMAVRDIATAERPEPRPVTLVNRPIKPNLRFEPPGGIRTMPLARETIDERRSLVMTVEKGRRILSGRAAKAGGALPRLLSRSGSLTTRTNITTQIVILPVPKVLATVRD